MKGFWIISFAALLLVGFAGLYFTIAGHPPAGQASLVIVDGQALSTMQSEFNRTTGGIRVILLLSPT